MSLAFFNEMIRSPVFRRRRRGHDRTPSYRRRLGALLLLALVIGPCVRSSAATTKKFQADEWITECGGDGGCSITVPFWQNGYEGKGSFALVVMLQTGNIGIVGTPPPVRAVLRIDKNPAATCAGSRCIFPTAQSQAVVKQLDTGSLILIDVFTAKSQFSFSLSPKGYQAGIAQIHAWGYQASAE